MVYFPVYEADEEYYRKLSMKPTEETPPEMLARLRALASCAQNAAKALESFSGADKLSMKHLEACHDASIAQMNAPNPEIMRLIEHLAAQNEVMREALQRYADVPEIGLYHVVRAVNGRFVKDINHTGDIAKKALAAADNQTWRV